MCRWLAYSGMPTLLSHVLYTPVHSMIDQSLHAPVEIGVHPRDRG